MLPTVQPDDVVMTMDSDGQDQASDVPRLLSALLQNYPSKRIVIARRSKRSETLTFKFMYFFFKATFRLLTGRVIRSGSFAATRGETLKQIIFHPFFDLCYSSALIAINFPIEYVECERKDRIAGKPRMSLLKLEIHAIRMLMPFLDAIAMRASVLFLATFFSGLGLSAVVVAVRLLTSRAIPGWATSTLLLMLSLSLGAIGQFIILFALFAQSQAVSLTGLDRHEPAGTTSSPAA
jgi:hypothetical protein